MAKDFYTTIDQSKKLFMLGLSPDTADLSYGYIAPYDYSDRMFDGGYDKIPYPKDFFIKNSGVDPNEYEGELPCWSIGALLNMLPNAVLTNVDNLWSCKIKHNGNDLYKWGQNSPIDAIFAVIVWLLENDCKNDLRLS